MKILVADDDAVSRRMMERILHRAGYDVVLAEDGREALESLVKPGRTTSCLTRLDDAWSGWPIRLP